MGMGQSHELPILRHSCHKPRSNTACGHGPGAELIKADWARRRAAPPPSSSEKSGPLVAGFQDGKMDNSWSIFDMASFE